MAAHNHGPDDPANPFCGESMVGGKLTGECLKSESQASVRAVLTEALSRSYYRIIGSSSDCRVDPGEILADALLSLPGVAVIQLPEPYFEATGDEFEDGRKDYAFGDVSVFADGEIHLFGAVWETAAIEEFAAGILAAVAESKRAAAAAAVVATGEERVSDVERDLDLDAIRDDIQMAARSPEMARHVALDHGPELVAEVERLRARETRIRALAESGGVYEPGPDWISKRAILAALDTGEEA